MSNTTGNEGEEARTTDDGDEEDEDVGDVDEEDVEKDVEELDAGGRLADNRTKFATSV